MAHVTLQLGRGLTIPFRRTRYGALRHVGIYNVAWRRQALREAQAASIGVFARGQPTRHVFGPRLPRRLRAYVVG